MDQGSVGEKRTTQSSRGVLEGWRKDFGKLQQVLVCKQQKNLPRLREEKDAEVCKAPLKTQDPWPWGHRPCPETFYRSQA